MRIATYALALVVVFIAAWEVGSRVRPWVGVAAETTPSSAADRDPAAGHDSADSHDTSDGHNAGSAPTTAPATPPQPTGLAAEVDGYRLTLLTPRPPAGPGTEIRFTIAGPDGMPVTSYQTAHDKQLHLIVVRRDLAGFQHVHPTLDIATGVWTTRLDTARAGTYRVFADFLPAGRDDGLVLGTDLAVAGDFDPADPATDDDRQADVAGYRIVLSGDLRAGRSGTLTATVTRDGRPVTDLDPYLGAYGHLVALRQSDLAYLHVHPEGHPGDGSTTPGPTIDFGVDVPTSGVYRLFLDVSHDGTVLTVPFTLVVSS